MATFVDFLVLEKFSSIFVMLFVMVAFYGIMQTRKFFGTSPTVHFTLAFAVGLIFIFNQKVINTLRFVLPWFVILMVAFLMLLMVTSIFAGVDVFQFLGSAGQNVMGTWYNWGFIIGIVIMILGVANSVGQDVGPFLSGENQSVTGAAQELRGSGDVASGSFQQNLGATIFHPKVLALIVVFFILAMSAFFITRVA